MPNKHVFIIHGWEGYPEEGWFPWLKGKLEEYGFSVSVPAMPDAVHPTMEKWVPHLWEVVGTPNKNCYFVGHSLGCITTLRYLETLEEGRKVGGAVLVAGFVHDLEYPDYKGEVSSFFRTPINWEKIRKHCKGFVAIHSEDDPWVPAEHNAIFKEKLGAEVIVVRGMKHFSGEDSVTELPLALEAVLGLAS